MKYKDATRNGQDAYLGPDWTIGTPVPLTDPCLPEFENLRHYACRKTGSSFTADRRVRNQ